MKKTITFIFPMYNEAQNIAPLWKELQSIQKKISNYKAEFIFVNDFSKDNTLKLLQSLAKKEPTIKVLSFSRNYGHQLAVTAGQDLATGDAVVIMDSDLQDPPEVSLDLIQKWEEGYDVVYAKRRKYKTNFIKEKSAWLFYRILCKISSVNIPVDTGDFRLLSKRVNDEMKKYKENSRFLRGISSLVGFKQTAVLFDRKDRLNGNTGYTFLKSLKLAIDGITGFSVAPIRLISLLGAVFAFLSFVIGFSYVIISILTGANISGWASTITAIYFLGGIQLLMLGILGEYIGRIFIESLNRPLYTIDYEESRLK
ncbi:glycosyltransferase [Candidatus Gracilibacteria bacterium]|nr:glycosyltransferase [Thermales bacterium]NJL96257.1 glycosyltransferase [Candidatus Gracilibacteria bacterium]